MYTDGVSRSHIKEDGRVVNSVNSLDRRIREVKKEVAKLNFANTSRILKTMIF